MAAVILTFSRAAETETGRVAEALKSRDPEFIGSLVMQYHYRLLRYLVYLTSRREQAEDLVQETWIRVLERAGQYDSRYRFEPWLFSIARHLAIDNLRKRQEDEEPANDLPASCDQSPFLAAARSEDATRVAAAMGALAPASREALLLRFQEDLSLEEIARVTGAPVSTVSSRIQRGLAVLRASLEGGAGAD